MNLVLGGLCEPLLITGGLGGVGGGTPTQQTFRQALRAKLAGTTKLTALVGPAIYPGALPETHDLLRDGPALTYTIATNPRGHVLGGSDGTSTARVQLSGWSYKLSDADSIAGVLFNALDGLVNDATWGNGTVTIMSCVQAEEIDLPEQVETGTDVWIHQIASEFAIKYRVSIPTHA